MLEHEDWIAIDCSVVLASYEFIVIIIENEGIVYMHMCRGESNPADYITPKVEL